MQKRCNNSILPPIAEGSFLGIQECSAGDTVGKRQIAPELTPYATEGTHVSQYRARVQEPHSFSASLAVAYAKLLGALGLVQVGVFLRYTPKLANCALPEDFRSQGLSSQMSYGIKVTIRKPALGGLSE